MIKMPTMRGAVFAIPAMLLAVLVPLGLMNGAPMPPPFLLLYMSVMAAALLGGSGTGLLAGCFGAGTVVFCHVSGIGPRLLVGTIFSTAFGILIYLGTGIVLGLLRDQRDRTLLKLHEAEAELRLRLDEETAALEASAKILNVSEVQLDQAARIAKLGYFVFDAQRNLCTVCSKRHAEIFGVSSEEFISMVAELDGNRLAFIHPEDQPEVREKYRRLRAGEEIDMEYRFTRSDGSEGYIREFVVPYFDEAGKAVRGIGSSIDLTEVRRTEQTLLHTQKMDAIGQLTGGIAHDFNNLLAVVLGNLELVEEQIGEDTELREEIDAAKGAVAQGADLIRNMLSFARKARLQPRQLDLGKVVGDVKQWAARVLPPTIEVETRADDDLYPVMADPSSTQSALLNLIVNARDAMPDGGRLTIETTNLDFSAQDGEESGDVLAPGRYVQLAVRDTGSGMSRADLDRIFDPFYTTKRPGEGSGLGLSMVQGFMSQTGGVVRVCSEPGRGTTFRLFFPALEVGQAVVRNEAPPQIEVPTIGARILVAEDEEGLRDLLLKMLRRSGYLPSVAPSGDAALLLDQREGPFDLLLSDVMMPGRLQGPDLATELRKVHPNMPVIFLTGQGGDHAELAETAHGLRLMKPIRREALIRSIECALSGTHILVDPA